MRSEALATVLIVALWLVALVIGCSAESILVRDWDSAHEDRSVWVCGD